MCIKSHCNQSLQTRINEVRHLHQVAMAAFKTGDCPESVAFVNSLIEAKLEDLESQYEVLAEQDDEILKQRIKREGLTVVAADMAKAVQS